MGKKNLIRKKYYFKRKKKYFEITENFFDPLAKLINKKILNKKIKISLFYPTQNEINVLKILENNKLRKYQFSLPVIKEKRLMNFYKWNKGNVLLLNKYGIPEPIKSKKIIPNVILVPLIAYDRNKNRVGYGKGFYDRYLKIHLKKYNKILTIGVAFSFQKHHKLPFNSRDVKLDYIITEKGIF